MIERMHLDEMDRVVVLAALDVYIGNWRRAIYEGMSDNMRMIANDRIDRAIRLSTQLGSR